MKRFNMRKYCYVFLWLGLVLSVGAVWLFGRGASQKETNLPVSSSSSVEDETSEGNDGASSGEPAEEKELAGVWVPYMALETEEHTQESFEENFKAITTSAKEKGLNALFVHVRPFCDALYPSKLYPWSHVLTGEQGQDPGFDPLKFMVEYAHSQQMEFHAWLNPLRVKTAETPGELSADHPYVSLKADSPYYFMEYQGGVYLDPAYPYVRALIAQGAAEIVTGYDVDGIHFDDYFYPSQDETLDSEAYGLYVQTVETPLPLLEWRQSNISAMIEEVYEAVKKAGPETVFGISPQGNIENDLEIGANVKAWCAIPGYVDYLCPQLYYSFENPALGYSKALEEWTNLPKHPGLKLYAGLALYKAGSDADQGTWQLSDDIISRQIQAAREVQCSGVVLYSSQYLTGEQTEQEVKNAMAALSPGQEGKSAD